jgi:hypothetical protein
MCVRRVLVGKSGERDHLEDPGLDGKIILEWIFRKRGGVQGLDRSVSVQGQVASSCKRGNEPLGSVKFRECVC